MDTQPMTRPNQKALPKVARSRLRESMSGRKTLKDSNLDRDMKKRVKGPRAPKLERFHSGSQDFAPPQAHFAKGYPNSARSDRSSVGTFGSTPSLNSTPASSWSGHSDNISPSKPLPTLNNPSMVDARTLQDRLHVESLRDSPPRKDRYSYDNDSFLPRESNDLGNARRTKAERKQSQEMSQVSTSRPMTMDSTVSRDGGFPWAHRDQHNSQSSLRVSSPFEEHQQEFRPMMIKDASRVPSTIQLVPALEPMVDLEEQEKLGRFSKFKNKYLNPADAPIVLPSAPTDKEKYSYLKTRRMPLYLFGMLSFMSLSAGMWLFVISSPVFYWFGVLVGLLQIYLMISYWVGFCGTDYDFKYHNDILGHYVVRDQDAPTVDIYLPCCKEPMQILENTYKFIQVLDYPRDKIQVYVLDDGGMPEVQRLAHSFGFNYITRDDKPRLKKAGNLRWAFARTKGDFFVIYDADFCPRRDFLKELIPHMRHDPKIAIIQTPQFFRVTPEQTWVEQGAGAIQELFYRLVQINRDRWGGSICVGSNALYRREALVETGGTAEIGFSEDVHTGFYSVDRGWKVKYIPICYACGICPDNQHAFFSQQMRWCMGSTTLLTNPDFWKSNLNFVQKLCYLSGMMYYSATALGIFVSPLPGVLVMWVRPDFLKYFNLAFAVPSILYSIIIFRLWSRASVTLAVNYIMVIQAYAYFTAIKDKIFGTALAWAPSGDKKAHKNTKYRNMRILCWCWTIVYTGVLVSGTVYRILGGYAWYNFVPLLLLNSMHLFYAHRFLLWR